MESLVLTWALSNAGSWATVAINSPIGDTIYISSFKKAICTLGLFTSIVALISTYIIFSPGSHLGTPQLSISTITWLAPHLLGSIYTVITTTYKFATHQL